MDINKQPFFESQNDWLGLKSIPIETASLRIVSITFWKRNWEIILWDTLYMSCYAFWLAELFTVHQLIYSE